MSITKKINVNDGSGRKFTDNTVGEIVLDVVPTVNSFNGVTSDAVARAVAGASGEVPQVTESDNGKVLKAVYDEGGPAVEWGEATVDQTYNAESTNAQSGTAVAEAIGTVNAVPASAVEDAGKVLTVDANGAAAWAEAQGGDVVVVTYDTTKVAEISAAIKDAIAAGKPVVMYNPTGKVVAPMTSCTVNGDTVDAQFCITKGTASTDKTYISYQLMGSIGVLFSNTGTIVPAVSLNTDAGKVLTAGSTPDAVSWQRVYPDIAGNAGKVLAVNSGATGTEWVSPATPSGGSDEWWGGDPGTITLPAQTLRLKFKDLTYDPRNETDTSFTDHFQSITKVSDGVYDFLFANVASGTNAGNPLFSEAFKNKYLAGSEFVILAFNFTTDTYGKAKNASGIFEGCTGLRAAYNVQDSNSGQNRGGSFSRAFYGCTGLVYFSVKDVNGNKDFRIDSVSSFTEMFKGCTSLVDCNLVISRVSGTATCREMFSGCASLVTGPSIDRSVSNANQMFFGCISLRGFHLNGVLGTFDIPSDTACSCGNMFYNCTSLESADIPFFLYHTVSGAGNMFRGCKKMKTPPRHIKVASGVSLDASYMFESCWELESLPVMDYSAVAGASNMFENCTMLPDISALAAVTWNASLADVGNMFKQCWGIEKGLKDVYDNMAATATITSHSNTFEGCGTAFSNPELAQIPSSWGGTGT